MAEGARLKHSGMDAVQCMGGSIDKPCDDVVC